MKTDIAITQPAGVGANPEYLRELFEWEAEDKVCPLNRAEELLEERRFEKVMRMTAARFAELSPVEKRNYARWAKHLRDVFAEKASLFERNSRPDPEVPAFLQVNS